MMDGGFRVAFDYTKAFVLVCAIAILSYGCIGNVAPEIQQFPVDSSAARNLSDQLTNDLTADRRDALFVRMDSAFTSTVSAKEFDEVCKQMVETYGRPIEFEFKQEELGSKLDHNGTTMAMRKFWYAAKTTKYDKGSHFLIVR